MNISKRDLRLVLILLSILIFILAYFLVYSKYETRTGEVETQKKELQTKLSQLQGYSNKLGEYEQAIESNKQTIKNEIAHYPNDVRSEELIMYAVDLEDEVGLSISTASFSGPQLVMPLRAILERDGTTENLTLTAYRNTLSITAELTYQQLKSFIDYINYTTYVTKLNTANLSFDSETGELMSTIIIDKFFITGADAEYYETEVPVMGYGTENIFGTITKAEPAAETAELTETAEAPTGG